MAFVSSRELNKDLEKKLYTQLIDIFTAHNGAYESSQLVYELFTPTERLMLAKRVSILALLERGYSTSAVAEILGTSASTTYRINVAREAGKYKHIQKVIQNKEYRKTVLGVLDTILTLGMNGSPQRKLNKQIRDELEAWKMGK